jgi:DNA-binding response OmpR family regulator
MTSALAGKRILIVEDEYFIASDLKRTLAKEGAIVIGPVRNLQAGLSLAEEEMDGAVLDVNLEEALSYPIADCLRIRNIPFMFLTGYDGWSMPTEYRDAARLEKPFPRQSVVAMVEKLVSAEPEAA